jgi:ABC-2 type transport system permease protein
MTLWRLEWLRLVRTRRWVALTFVYLFFGLLGPITARYIGEIVKRFGGGVTVSFPDPTAADGITQFVGNASQIGLLVAVVVAAGALSLDAVPEIGTFFRTRVPSLARILLPRFTVTSAVVVGAFALGTLAAWYETVVLIGNVPAGRLLAGWILGAIYLVFVVAVVALVAARTSSVLTTVLATMVILLGLPIAGIVPDVGEWLPSHLVGALDGMVRGVVFTEYLRAAVVTVMAGTVALWAAISLSSRRES